MEIRSLDLLELIKSRRSVKNFLFKKLTPKMIKEILECGRWAPSVDNTQPWRVNIVTHPTVKMMLAELASEYAETFETAACCFVIFLDLERSKDRIRDILSIGAFIENLLLAIHSLDKLGAVFITDILSKKEDVNKIFKLSSKNYELMGIIALGAIDEETDQYKSRKDRKRRNLDDFIDWF